jgi:hypothetical protein
MTRTRRVLLAFLAAALVLTATLSLDAAGVRLPAPLSLVKTGLGIGPWVLSGMLGGKLGGPHGGFKLPAGFWPLVVLELTALSYLGLLLIEHLRARAERR